MKLRGNPNEEKSKNKIVYFYTLEEKSNLIKSFFFFLFQETPDAAKCIAAGAFGITAHVH